MSIGFGIIGLGGISRRFLTVLRETDRAHVAAVAARNGEKARAWAQEFGSPAAYGDYEQLLADPNVQAVYIGLTHNLHARWCRRALEMGKAVLCEKPLVTRGEDARALADLAREKGVLLMEAMWTRCMPAVRRATEWARSGLIGRVRSIHASFGFNAPFRPEARLYNPDLAGGALMDAGIYPLAFAIGVLGEHPVEAAGVCEVSPSGVDVHDHIALRFPSGALAELSCAINLRTDSDAVIQGDAGRIVVRDFLRSTLCELYDAEGEPVESFAMDVDDGFICEIEHFCDLVEQGAAESPLMPLRDSIACADLFDELFAAWGLERLQG